MRRSVLLFVALGSLLGCDLVFAGRKGRKDAGTALATDDPPAPPTAPAPAPVATDAASLEKSFATFDLNPDGNLDGIELQRCACQSADRDGNGEVSKAEYMAAGLLGKLPSQQPGARPSTPVAQKTQNTKPIAPPAPGPQPPSPTPAPAPAPAGGAALPLGTYKCFSLVGQSFVARGSFTIVDGSRYQMPDGTGAGNYVFDPGTKKIRWTSGVYADPNAVKEAWQVSDKQISMKTGKDGFYQYDCNR